MRSTLVWNSSSGLPLPNWVSMSRPCCWVQATRHARLPAISSRRGNGKRLRTAIGTGWKRRSHRGSCDIGLRRRPAKVDQATSTSTISLSSSAVTLSSVSCSIATPSRALACKPFTSIRPLAGTR
ncbi:hypothetical protein WR25_22259 [Diploscapter pachys]|uniref:Uncharacterized protein n=1 Tax=Diploscapter pachys TaxID=2018661 RepID=A0A2A2M549_9BILA|nr:hypothetical protein WR25_22259 [Diploscapter pachys]